MGGAYEVWLIRYLLIDCRVAEEPVEYYVDIQVDLRDGIVRFQREGDPPMLILD